MTQVQTEAPVLTLTADLGDAPALSTVSSYLRALDELWTFVMSTPLVNVPIAREHLEHTPVLSNFPPERDPRRAAVRRLRIASPLETMLAPVVGELRPFAYVAAGIYAVEHILHLVMAWQKHRADLGKKIDADADERDAFGVTVIQELVSDSDARRIGMNLPPANAPMLRKRSAGTSVGRLARHRIIEVRVIKGKKGLADF